MKNESIGERPRAGSTPGFEVNHDPGVLKTPRSFARWNPYPKYRDSGVEWLGAVPEGWEVHRIKSLTKEHKQGYYTEEEYIDEGVRLVRITDIDDNSNIVFENMPFVKITKRNEKDFQVEEGDFLFARSGTIGRFGIVHNPERAVFASYLIRFRFNDIYREYMKYALKSAAFQESLISSLHGGANKNIHAENIKDRWIAVPVRSEQIAISYFLDRETSKIDALIAKKERLIELLQEKRTALITRAVTKGLFGLRHRDAALNGADASAPLSENSKTESGDTSPQSKGGYSGTQQNGSTFRDSNASPNPKFKDSGVEWLGEVPSHWEIKRLKFLLESKKASIKTGPFGSQLQSSEMMAGEIKVYNQRNVIDKDFEGGENYISNEKYEELKAFQAFPGDLLVTTRGSIGRCAELPQNAEIGILHPCLMRLHVDRKQINNKFLELLIEQSGLILEQLRLMSNATTIDVIYSESMKEVRNAIPPLSEQSEIIKYLNIKTYQVDLLISKIQSAISLLKEYRTALISAAVTGKIDVRGEAA